MSNIERYILIGLATIFVFTFLRWLKRYLRRNEIQEAFPYLHPFGKATLSGKEVMVFDLPVAGRVSMELIDLNGTLVRSGFDEQFRAGMHQKGFDFSGLEPGAYQLKVSFANQTTTRRVVIA